jgi:DNA-binding MarR family transcriptional regulator
LRVLVDDGIVFIKASAADKRFKKLALTKKGVGLVRSVTNNLKRLETTIRTGR